VLRNAVRGLLGESHALAQARLELFKLDGEDLLWRVIWVSVLAALLVALVFFGLLAALAALIFIVGVEHGAWITGSAALIALIVAAALAWQCRRLLRPARGFFGASLAQFARDGEALKAKEPHGPVG